MQTELPPTALAEAARVRAEVDAELELLLADLATWVDVSVLSLDRFEKDALITGRFKYAASGWYR